MTPTDKKTECIRIRVEERLSLAEISARTGVSKGTLSVWLRPYPLTKVERHAKFLFGQKKPTLREERYPNMSPFTSFMKAVETLSRQEKGRIAEAAVLLRLSLLGLIPAKPVFDGERSDWLVELPGTSRIKRVQVKWMKRSEYGQPRALLTSTGSSGKVHRYTQHDFDVLVGYDINTDACYVWDWAAIGSARSCVSASESSREAWSRLLTI